MRRVVPDVLGAMAVLSVTVAAGYLLGALWMSQ